MQNQNNKLLSLVSCLHQMFLKSVSFIKIFINFRYFSEIVIPQKAHFVGRQHHNFSEKRLIILSLKNIYKWLTRNMTKVFFICETVNDESNSILELISKYVRLSDDRVWGMATAIRWRMTCHHLVLYEPTCPPMSQIKF